MRFRLLWYIAAIRTLSCATPLDPAYRNSQGQIRITQDAVLSGSREQTPPPLDGMVHRNLALSGPIDNRVNLVFFGDGYTQEEEKQFFLDAQRLTEDIVKPNASYGPVSTLLNVHAVFVPSIESGIGTQGKPKDTPFGLYRPGSELRGVLYQHKHRVIEACKYWREMGKGCDEPILLGNDPLYGGLGGTPTVITASRVNGPHVLRHELGHTLIPAGEEYDGGYAYFGANSAPVSALSDGISWKHWLSEPQENLRMQDSKVPLQAYPWQDLMENPYMVRFNASSGEYPTALLRLSISGIPYESHLNLTLNGVPVAFSIPARSRGENDRAWIQIPLESGLGSFGNVSKDFELVVRLTKLGRSAPVTQGGKMLTSIEIIEYGPPTTFNKTAGYIGAFPTYDDHGKITLRPTDETCLMRDVTYPSFCPVCLESLYLSLLGRVDLIDDITITCNEHDAGATLETTLIDLPGAEKTFVWSHDNRPLDVAPESASIDVSETGWWRVQVDVELPEIRKRDSRTQATRTIWFGGCDSAM